MDKGYPLILVFYLNGEMMRNKDIIVPFTESVNNAIAIREANAMAFFLPTEGEERIECINPLTVPEEKIEEINKIIEDLKKNFDIGQGADENLESDEDVQEDN
jgi:hypothetical protein